MKYSQKNPFKIDADFFEYAKTELKGKIKGTTVTKNVCEFTIEDSIRDSKEMIKLIFIREDNNLSQVDIEMESNDRGVNEYDLKVYVSDLMLKILSRHSQGKKQQYTIRNYFNYYNSMPIAGEIHISFGKKSKISSFQEFSPKLEPLTEQVLIVDTQVNAVNINQALGDAFNHAKNVVSLLSVLLDVGFEPMNSNFRMFIIPNEHGMDFCRYRTGFLDNELRLVVKNNLNGLLTPEEAANFWQGRVAFTMPGSNGGTNNIYDVSDKKEIDKIFSTYKILKNRVNTAKYVDGISTEPHFPNTEIMVPRLIRKYFRHVANLPASENALVLAFARLYNLAEIYHRIGEATSTVSYKISSIEALAQTEAISFGEFVRKYSTGEMDEKLIDYFYGNVRSGHFHAGRFSFGEYDHSFNYEYDVIFQERKELFFTFCRTIRKVVAKWIELSLGGARTPGSHLICEQSGARKFSAAVRGPQEKDNHDTDENIL